ncbi:MAG TPA: hypothetical protein VF658_13865 [Pyrinomonadaceae bacterium]|jgi:hypothetical protein
MLQKRQRATSAVALLLVFSLSQFYVQANLSGKSSLVKNAAINPSTKTGRLTTRGNNPITLNGNPTHSGTTVLSGSQLQTPAGVGASVQLGRLGLLRLAPETSLVLNFDERSIDVALDSGYATLTTNEGIKGSITTPDGKTERTDPANLSTIIGQTGQQDDDDDDDDKKAGLLLGSGSDEGVGLLGGISNDAARAFGLVVLGGAIAGSLIIANLEGDDRPFNPSPSTP